MIKKLNKNYGLALFLFIGAIFQLCADTGPGVQVDFEMTVPDPTCDVNVSSNNIDLGELVYGDEVSHDQKKLTLKIICTATGGKKSLTANYLSGGQLQNDKMRVAVKMGNNPLNTTDGPFLKLKKEDGTFVKLDNSSAFFTAGAEMSSSPCELTPVTQMGSNAPPGEGSVMIQFNMTYKV